MNQASAPVTTRAGSSEAQIADAAFDQFRLDMMVILEKIPSHWDHHKNLSLQLMNAKVLGIIPTLVAIYDALDYPDPVTGGQLKNQLESQARKAEALVGKQRIFDHLTTNVQNITGRTASDEKVAEAVGNTDITDERSFDELMATLTGTLENDRSLGPVRKGDLRDEIRRLQVFRNRLTENEG